MRALSAHLQESTEALTTQPWTLIRIGDSYLTDGPTTTWAGITWQSVPGLTVDGVVSGPSGLTRATIRIPSHTGLGTALLFAAGDEDLPVAIYQVYGPGPHALADAVEMGVGALDGGRAEGEWAELAVAEASESVRELPRLRVAPPYFNHLPPPGTRIKWGSDVLVLG